MRKRKEGRELFPYQRPKHWVIKRSDGTYFCGEDSKYAWFGVPLEDQRTMRWGAKKHAQERLDSFGEKLDPAFTYEVIPVY